MSWSDLDKIFQHMIKLSLIYFSIKEQQQIATIPSLCVEPHKSCQSPLPASAEEELLERALQAPSAEAADSVAPTPSGPPAPGADSFGAMTEEEQIAYAMRLSMEPSGGLCVCNLL